MGGLRDAFILDAVRTPIGRHGGALARVRPDDLAAYVIAAVVSRSGAPVDGIDDVVLGCANQSGEDNRNVARMAALLAGLPVSVPGVTVNRLCASGLEAIADAARRVATGQAELVIAGGVESMSRAPLVLPKAEAPFARGNLTAFDTTLGWRFVNPRMEAKYGVDTLGETAEKVAERYKVSRAVQDAFALGSQRKYGAAQAAGKFRDELVAVEFPGPEGTMVRVDKDEHPRPELTAEDLARLPPVFRTGGTVTAGNSSGINDGAAVLLIGSEAMRSQLAQARLSGARLRVTQAVTVGVEPALMGLGPIPAVRKLWTRTGLRAADMDLIECNEAFAAQCVPCINELGLDPERVNVNGGAIALGHPLGCTGARMATTLVHELVRRDAQRGLVTLCVGVGQGMAVLVERG